VFKNGVFVIEDPGLLCSSCKKFPVLHFSVIIFCSYFGIIDASTINCSELSNAQAGARLARGMLHVFIIPHIHTQSTESAIFMLFWCDLLLCFQIFRYKQKQIILKTQIVQYLMFLCKNICCFYAKTFVKEKLQKLSIMCENGQIEALCAEKCVFSHIMESLRNFSYNMFSIVLITDNREKQNPLRKFYTTKFKCCRLGLVESVHGRYWKVQVPS
jgi:hypothetical protein